MRSLSRLTDFGRYGGWLGLSVKFGSKTALRKLWVVYVLWKNKRKFGFWFAAQGVAKKNYQPANFECDLRGQYEWSSRTDLSKFTTAGGGWGRCKLSNRVNGRSPGKFCVFDLLYVSYNCIWASSFTNNFQDSLTVA